MHAPRPRPRGSCIAQLLFPILPNTLRRTCKTAPTSERICESRHPECQQNHTLMPCPLASTPNPNIEQTTDNSQETLTCKKIWRLHALTTSTLPSLCRLPLTKNFFPHSKPPTCTSFPSFTILISPAARTRHHPRCHRARNAPSHGRGASQA